LLPLMSMVTASNDVGSIRWGCERCL
jgi:hypothetical protein